MKIRRAEKDEHRDTCPKSEVMCMCQIKMKREEMADHIQGACKMTDVHCPLRCGATIKRYDGIMHTVTIPFLCACLLSSRHELKGHSHAILVHFTNQKYVPTSTDAHK